MDRPTFKKPRHHFDTASHPSHVEFDDGKTLRILPWSHFSEARWTRAEPETIEVTIADLVVEIRGSNLAPLLAAITERTLLRLRAQPELRRDPEREPDTFAISIRFLKSLAIETPEKRDETRAGHQVRSYRSKRLATPSKNAPRPNRDSAAGQRREILEKRGVYARLDIGEIFAPGEHLVRHLIAREGVADVGGYQRVA